MKEQSSIHGRLIAYKRFLGPRGESECDDILFRKPVVLADKFTARKRVGKSRGFTLLEILVTIGIIGLLVTVTVIAVTPSLRKGRDAKRKASLAQVGRFLSGASCYMPDAGDGDYDLADIFSEVTEKNPQIKKMMATPPKDPRGGTNDETKYRYLVSENGKRCALYVNLENENEPVTLEAISVPTPGGGTGVFQGGTEGPNGTFRYFQATN